MIATDVTLNTRLSGDVIRYHAWPTLTTQTVAHHTWNVIRIYCEVFGPPKPADLVRLVYHDSPEVMTGDVPFPIKMNNPHIKRSFEKLEDDWYDAVLHGREIRDAICSMSTEQFATRKKFCDLMEMAEFALHEMRLGNEYADMIWQNVVPVMQKIKNQTVNDEDCSAISSALQHLDLLYRAHKGTK